MQTTSLTWTNQAQDTLIFHPQISQALSTVMSCPWLSCQEC